MLNLNARIHLHEIESAVLKQELDRAGIDVFHGLTKPHRCLPHLVANILSDRGRRRFFDQLLMPALNRAFALAKGDDAPLDVAENLNLDVPWVLEILFNVDIGRTECAIGLAASGVERALQVAFGGADPHSPPAAARCCLEDHRKSDRARDLESV